AVVLPEPAPVTINCDFCSLRIFPSSVKLYPCFVRYSSMLSYVLPTGSVSPSLLNSLNISNSFTLFYLLAFDSLIVVLQFTQIALICNHGHFLLVVPQPVCLPYTLTRQT